MASYQTDNSTKPIVLSVTVISPAPAATIVYLEGNKHLESPVHAGGNILPTAVGENLNLKGKELKIDTIIDLSILTDEEKKQALKMIKTRYFLEGGPEGKKQFWVLPSSWVFIDDELYITKYIALI